MKNALRFFGIGVGLLTGAPAVAQNGVGIGTTTPHPSAALDVSSTQKGLLLPRLTQAQRDAISAPALGLTIYQTDNTPGLYLYSGTTWVPVGGGSGAADNLGNHTATQALSLGNYPLTGTAPTLGGFVGGGFIGNPTAGLTVAADGRVSLTTPFNGNWVAANIGSATTAASFTRDRVVIGTFGERATVGGHNNTVSAWAPLYLNPGGNVGVGNAAATEKLTVEGQVFSTTGGFRFPDGTVQTTAVTASTGADNLGNHTATQTLNLAANALAGSATTGATPGLTVAPNGQVNLTAVAGWIGASVGMPSGDRVVSGNNGGRATLGAHTAALSGWAPLYLNPGGNVGVGNAAATEKLTVEGQVFSTTGGFRFPDNSVLTTVPVLSKTGATISLSSGGTVADADNQTLSVSGTSLSLSGGNTVSLPSDNLGNHTATQMVNLGNWPIQGTLPASVATSTGLSLSGDGQLTVNNTASAGMSSWVAGSFGSFFGPRLVVGSYNGVASVGGHTRDLSAWTPLTLNPGGGYVGIGTAAPTQPLEVAGQIFSSTGGFRFPDNTVQTTAAAAQTLSISGQTLGISNGNTVMLPPGADNLGNHAATQNLALGTHRLTGTATGPAATGLSVAPDGQTRISTTNSGSGTANWIATSAGGATGPRVVSGLLAGVATVGGHTAALDAWTDLALSPGGNVGVGTNAPTAKLHVVGTEGGGYAPASIASAAASSTNPSTSVAAAYDNNSTTFWEGASATLPQWVRYTLGQPTVATRYQISVLVGPQAPSVWRLEASQDPTFAPGTEVVLHSATAPANITQTLTYDFANTTAYLHYRLLITSAWNPAAGGNVQVAEFALIERVSSPVALRVAPGAVQLESGVPVRAFSSDATLAANADDVVPTQRAVRTFVLASLPLGADNLGNHTATQPLNLNGQLLTGGGAGGLLVSPFGAVGLGTAAPTAHLDVRGIGGVRAYTTNPGSGTTDWFSAFGGAANTFMSRVVAGTLNGVATVGGHIFDVNNIPQYWANLAINPDPGSGNVGIGIANPTEKLHVVGNFYNVGNTGITGRLTVGGTVSFCGGAYTCSDRRYKRDITPLQNVLQNVLNLSGYTYFWRREEFKEKNFTADRQLGFIAQEVEALYPEMVLTDEKTGYKSVDYSRMTPVLLEAIKELNAKLEAANARADRASAATTSFEARLRALEAGSVGQARK